MTRSTPVALAALTHLQQADFEVGSRSGPWLKAKVQITSVGLLSIAILTSAILLSTAVVVRAARRQ